MKIGRLYIKFFLTFVAILIVTEMLIFSFFHFVIGRNMEEHIANINRYTLGNLVEDRVARHPDLPPERNTDLEKLMDDLGRIYNARIWITQGERIICSTSDTGCPAGQRHCRKRNECRGRMLFSAPVSLPGGETGILHMSLKKPSRGLNDMTFAMGLAGIGVLIAAMLFPLYRFISRPLSELKAAAIGISEGNLSARAGIRSSDEIGELASAFNRMAENVERMVKSTRELTANISHELRSPLARIQVAGELLDEKLGQPENARRYLESIREETAEIDRLIGDILMLSRLDMNAANTKVTEFDLTAALKELVGRWVASAEHAGLSMEMNIPDKSVIIRAGRDDIMRAIDSLIANAVKFTPENGIVSVRLEDTGHAVMTRVRNTCAPLSPEQLEKIFEPFYRIPGGASQGTGLGLTIARRIAVNVGGSLTVSSWEQGIEMTLSIPALGKN